MSNLSPPGSRTGTQRSDASPVNASRLLGLLRGVAQKRLSGVMGELFAGVDDALFDMAERGSTNSNQSHYFDGMREIRRKRLRAEALWQEAINRQMLDFEAGKLAPGSEQLGTTKQQAAQVAMALVDESELEESLAVTAMIDKADGRLTRGLFALNLRLGILVAGPNVDNANNPLGPRLLAQAFRSAISEFDVDLPVRLIVLKLFERQVLAALEPLYEECNTILVQAGVMPELRYASAANRRAGAQRGDASQRSADAAGEAAVADALAEVGGDSRSDSEILQVVSELRGLLASRRTSAPQEAHAHHSGVAGSAQGSTGATARELLNALSLMQEEMQVHGTGASATTQAAHVKQELMHQVRRLGGPAGGTTHMGADEDTIDLVGMLFDYAVQDRNLPAPIAAMLGRLQIPYLKVALLDQEFIAHKHHPARQLLDELGQACVGWSEESDKDHRLYNKVQEVVSTLLRDFDDDTGIFERLSTDFSDFIGKNRKRAELVERRTTEAARGRERLEIAQRSAARALLTKLEGRHLPPMVRDLLSRKWSNYLVLTHLRHGEDSTEWRAATRFIDDFAWSVEPKKDDADRVRLGSMTPEIERLLRHGLAATGLHEGHLQELWGEVAEMYRQQSNTAAARAPEARPAPPADLSVRFAAGRAGEEIVFSPADAHAIDDEVDLVAVEALGTWMNIARALKAGTWFEFVKDDGSRERAKLLWISTIRALYLFVNRNGLKIAEKTAGELAEELKGQKAVILEQVALVDRALDAILVKLKDGAAEGSAEAAPAGAAKPPAAMASGSPAVPKIPSPALVRPALPPAGGVRGPSTPTRH